MKDRRKITSDPTFGDWMNIFCVIAFSIGGCAIMGFTALAWKELAWDQIFIRLCLWLLVMQTSMACHDDIRREGDLR